MNQEMRTPAEEWQRELSAIRLALGDAVEQGSLRSVARETGMSATGLRALLDGAEPYLKTRDKVRLWMARHVVRRRATDEITAPLASGLLRTLLGRVPDSRLRLAQARLVSALEQAHDEADVERPEWLREMREHVGG